MRSPCLPAYLPTCLLCSVAANQDLWQLVGAHATAPPLLVKVLVRADEGQGGPGGATICAAVAMPASATGEACMGERAEGCLSQQSLLERVFS